MMQKSMLENMLKNSDDNSLTMHAQKYIYCKM